jgi:hypothetical protein
MSLQIIIGYRTRYRRLIIYSEDNHDQVVVDVFTAELDKIIKEVVGISGIRAYVSGRTTHTLYLKIHITTIVITASIKNGCRNNGCAYVIYRDGDKLVTNRNRRL